MRRTTGIGKFGGIRFGRARCRHPNTAEDNDAQMDVSVEWRARNDARTLGAVTK